MQVAININGSYTSVKRIVTSEKGSWKWQDAYRESRYIPVQKKDGTGYYWKSVAQSNKFAHTKATAHFWAIGQGSLNNRPAFAVVDDFGNLVFVA